MNQQETHHILATDPGGGIFVEKIFDDDRNLIQLHRRARDSRSETHFDPKTGDIQRILENSKLLDGNLMRKEVVYADANQSFELVVIISPTGELVRKVERENIGIHTIVQAQTDYNADGTPALTVTYARDAMSGQLLHRQQAQWKAGPTKSLTEDFYFDRKGNLTEYVRAVYQENSLPIMEETQIYDPTSQTLKRKETIVFGSDGKEKSVDVVAYSHAGEIELRSSTFYDDNGNTIAFCNINDA